MYKNLYRSRPNLRFVEAPAGGEQGAGAAGTEGGKDSGYTPPATQADLDKIISDRLARDRAKYADFDKFKAAATELDQIKAATATDLERAVKEADTKARAEVTGTLHATLRAAEARALAAAAKFRNPTDVVALLGASLNEVPVTGTEVDSAALKALVDDLAKKSPYLVDDGKKQDEHVVPGAGAGDAGTAIASPGIGNLRLGFAQSKSKH